jgi:EAL domain-containing protein (putative c-di-GMP-specific phosphodiesterase class I)
LGNEEFLNFVTEQLDQVCIAPGQLCFEITETAAIANLPSMVSKMLE